MSSSGTPRHDREGRPRPSSFLPASFFTERSVGRWWGRGHDEVSHAHLDGAWSCRTRSRTISLCNQTVTPQPWLHSARLNELAAQEPPLRLVEDRFDLGFGKSGHLE